MILDLKMYPHHGCFPKEWQAKGLCLTRLVRVAAKGLKVAGFSVSCRLSVRVARKGLKQKGVGRLEGLKVGRMRSEERTGATRLRLRGGGVFRQANIANYNRSSYQLSIAILFTEWVIRMGGADSNGGGGSRED